MKPFISICLSHISVKQRNYFLPRKILATSLLLFSQIMIQQTAFGVTGVNPTGVNVNHTGVTTVFLTFQNVATNEQPIDAFWCSDVTATGVSSFNPCVPGTLLGNLPLRNNLARNSGTNGTNNLTDIMTIPSSVSRRAFQLAQQSSNGTFFYVRRFSDGITDTFVTVTCRLAGGGARTPLALTEVRIQYETADGLRPVYFLSADQSLPPIQAKIEYNGTGRLKGRWEVMMPGDPEPTDIDLLTEATLPVEQRASQRRYTLLSRFDVFLPPTGKMEIPGPDPEKIPTNFDGPYKILFRVEASAEKEGNSNTLDGLAISGGVAGFPMPVLRYFIGDPDSFSDFASRESKGKIALMMPAHLSNITAGEKLTFSWQPTKGATLYKLDVKREQDTVLAAVVKKGSSQYTAPPWLDDVAGTELKWRITALDIGGKKIAQSEWREFTLLQQIVEQEAEQETQP